MSRPQKKHRLPDGAKLIANNRRALFNYEVLDDVEAGIMLQGTEVKSLREGAIQILDAYASFEGRELFLYNAHVAEYAYGNIYNHEPTRRRKLLLHRRELDQLAEASRERGVTLIPLEFYFLRGRVKLRLGLCRGKRMHDKRASIRERDETRASQREMAEHR